jgi:hypothetical protein
MTMDQLRGELPSNVYRLTLNSGEVAGYVNGQSLPELLVRAATLKKIRNRNVSLLRFKRLTLAEVGNLRDNGMTFK